MILLEYLKEFQGILGVLLGLTLTMLINIINKKSGTVKAHVDYFKDKAEEVYIGPDPSGDGNSRIKGYEIKSGILFENTSEVMRSIYDLKFVIHSDSGDFQAEIEDADTQRSDELFRYFDKVRHLNLGQKQMIYLNARTYFEVKDVPYNPGDKVSISYFIADKRFRKKQSIELNID